MAVGNGESMEYFTIGAQVDKAFYQRLDDYCWANRLNRSEVIRTAVAEYMDRRAPSAQVPPAQTIAEELARR